VYFDVASSYPAISYRVRSATMGDVTKGKNSAAECKETATADRAELVCAGGLKHGCRLQVQKAIPTGAPLITDHRSVVTAAMCARDGGILVPISSGGRP
jgi:hypothetical protein